MRVVFAENQKGMPSACLGLEVGVYLGEEGAMRLELLLPVAQEAGILTISILAALGNARIEH